MDVAWWSMTRKWPAGNQSSTDFWKKALPHGEAKIGFSFTAKSAR
jgi:hypothetical protein